MFLFLIEIYFEKMNQTNKFDFETVFGNCTSFKNGEKCFIFHVKNSFLWRCYIGNKQLQYTYCPIPQEVKTVRQSNLASQ